MFAKLKFFIPVIVVASAICAFFSYKTFYHVGSLIVAQVDDAMPHGDPLSPKTWSACFADGKDELKWQPPAYCGKMPRGIMFPFFLYPFQFKAVHAGNKDIAQNFEKLNFSMPGEPGYTGDPDWDVFNPDGKIKGTINYKEFSKGFTEKSKILYVLYRFPQSEKGKNGIFLDVIYLVLSHPKSNVCSEHLDFEKLPRVPDLTPNINGAVLQGVDGQYIYSKKCVLDPDGNWYWFHPIGLRHKGTMSDKWE